MHWANFSLSYLHSRWQKRDAVSMYVTKYLLSCLDTGVMGPQTSDDIRVAMLSLCAVCYCVINRAFPVLRALQEIFVQEVGYFAP